MRFRLCPRPPSCPVAGPAGTVFFQGDLGLLVKNKMCLGFTSPAGGREGSWDVTSARRRLPKSEILDFCDIDHCTSPISYFEFPGLPDRFSTREMPSIVERIPSVLSLLLPITSLSNVYMLTGGRLERPHGLKHALKPSTQLQCRGMGAHRVEPRSVPHAQNISHASDSTQLITGSEHKYRCMHPRETVGGTGNGTRCGGGDCMIDRRRSLEDMPNER
ncbi:hypothetical protein V8E53_000651 [Lactarius tabidus]